MVPADATPLSRSCEPFLKDDSMMESLTVSGDERVGVVRAALFRGTPGEFFQTWLPRPEPEPGELLVDVVGCTLCGSDLHTYEGRRQVAVPTVLGHEIVGRIAAIGDHATPPLDLEGDRLAVGDRVVWAIVAACGGCAPCERGLPQKCERGVKYGHERATDRRTLTGGLADVCLLAPGTAVVKIPADMPLEVACPASCATATITAVFEPAGDITGRTIAVFGLGLLGLTACAMARSKGASDVIAIDPLPARRRQGLAFGATDALSPGQVASHPAAGRIDLAIEVSGAPAAFVEAVGHLGLGGAVHLVGAVAPMGTVAVDPEHVVRRLLTIRGIHNYAPRHLLAAVRFLATHGRGFPFAGLVSGWYPLCQAAEAFAAAAQTQAVLVGVRP